MPQPTRPLRQLVLQGFAIVASILLAFGIDAWWDERGESRERRQILQDLRDEFIAERATLADDLENWTVREHDIGRLLQATRLRQPPAVAVMDTLIRRLTWAGTYDPSTGVRDALIASGRLGLLTNLRLRSQLAAWQGVVDELRDNQLASREFILLVLDSYLARKGVAVDRSKAVSMTWPADLTPDEQAERAYREIVADPEFAALVAQRYAWINLNEIAEAIAFADSILRNIDQDLPF